MNSLSQSKVFKREVAARVIQSKPLSGDAERLARGSANKKVNWLMAHTPEFVIGDGGEVPKERCPWVVVLEDGTGE